MNFKKNLTRENLTLFFCGFFLSIILTLIALSLIRMEEFKNKKVKSIAPSNSPTDSSLRAEFFIKASIPYWDQENAFNVFQNNVRIISYINLFWYYLGENGEIKKYEYGSENKNIISFAHTHNVKVSAVLTNLPEYAGATWDSDRVIESISEKKRQKHIENIVDKLDQLNFDGVIIDYESVNSQAKDEFTIFIKELSKLLHKNNKILTVVLHPKTGNNIPEEEIGRFQDWSALPKYADQLQIMGYSEHSDTDSPGPIASTPWVGKILAYAKGQKVPLEKVFLGIPLYGYDWDKNTDASGKDLTYGEVEKLLSKYGAHEKWDQQNNSPYFTYVKNNHTHEVWFENSKSIEKKIELAKNAGLAGVTFWRLGEEDPKIWSMLEQIQQTR